MNRKPLKLKRDLDALVLRVKLIASHFGRDEVRYNRRENGACYYTSGKCSDGSTGCLIGQALLSGEFCTKAQLRHIDYQHRSVGADSDIGSVIAGLGDLRDEKLAEDPRVRWLGHVQRCQDAGYTWKAAVEHADKLIKL